MLSLRGSITVKKLLVIFPLALSLVSCQLFKKGTKQPGTADAPVANNSGNKNSPAFIENISIAPDKKQETIPNNSHPPLNDEAVNIAPMGPELFYELQFKYAILLDVPVEEMIDHKMLELLESWYGTRYRMGGTDKTGVDCSAFVQSFMIGMYGLMLPRTSAEQYSQCKRIQKKQLQEGDLVFFRTQRRKGVSHVGIYLRNNKFVHASTSSGVMISDLDDEYFSKRYVGAGRYKN